MAWPLYIPDVRRGYVSSASNQAKALEAIENLFFRDLKCSFSEKLYVIVDSIRSRLIRCLKILFNNFETFAETKIFALQKFWSAFTAGETPVPIPNTEVKPRRADGSVVVRLCESRSALLKLKKPIILFEWWAFLI